MAFWHWLILAAIFAAVEIVAPGVFFIWLGVAAAITGFMVFFLSAIGWEAQGIVFAILAFLSVASGRRFQRFIQPDLPATNLNRRSAQLIGRFAVLTEPIQNGRGNAKIDDTIWRVEGEDMPAGTKVKITDADGPILKVNRLD